MKYQGAIAFLPFIFGLAAALPSGQASEGALKRVADVNAHDDCRVPSGCVNMDPEGCAVACYKRDTTINARGDCGVPTGCVNTDKDGCSVVCLWIP